MKSIIVIVGIAAISFAACNSGNNTSASNDTTQAKSQTDSPVAKETTTSSGADAKVSGSMKEILSHYFHLKNALTNDDGKNAATAGKAIVEAMSKLDTTLISADQKKVYRDLEDDIRENAEHIGANADKIAHQREHFEMLSKDIYDLVKKFGAGQTVYQDFCPMYNNKKGATWISETKEIKNPYLGKEMPTCGVVKEEIK